MAQKNDQARAVSNELRDILKEYSGRTGAGIILPPRTTFLLEQPGKPVMEQIPEIAFLRADRVPEGDALTRIGRIMPDVVIEVAGVSQKKAPMTAKAQDWLRAGVKLIWIVWPEAKQIVVWRNRFDAPEALGAGDVLADETLLPGFSHPIADLF